MVKGRGVSAIRASVAHSVLRCSVNSRTVLVWNDLRNDALVHPCCFSKDLLIVQRRIAPTACKFVEGNPTVRRIEKASVLAVGLEGHEVAHGQLFYGSPLPVSRAY